MTGDSRLHDVHVTSSKCMDQKYGKKGTQALLVSVYLNNSYKNSDIAHDRRWSNTSSDRRCRLEICRHQLGAVPISETSSVEEKLKHGTIRDIKINWESLWMAGSAGLCSARLFATGGLFSLMVLPAVYFAGIINFIQTFLTTTHAISAAIKYTLISYW